MNFIINIVDDEHRTHYSNFDRFALNDELDTINSNLLRINFNEPFWDISLDCDSSDKSSLKYSTVLPNDYDSDFDADLLKLHEYCFGKKDLLLKKIPQYGEKLCILISDAVSYELKKNSYRRVRKYPDIIGNDVI